MITVIDSIMGSGKTTFAINQMVINKHKNFLFITPFLEQIKRIQKDAAELDKTTIIETPSNKGAGKLNDLKKILQNNPPRIIVTTHSLFLLFDEEILDIFKKLEYTLMIDETIDDISIVDISPSEISILLNSSAIEIEQNKVIWTGKYDKPIMPDFLSLYHKIINGKIWSYKESVLIEQPNPNILRTFNNIWIFTYMFESSIFRCFLEIHDFKYNTQTLTKDGKIDNYRYQDGRQYRNFVSIYNGKLNTNFNQLYSGLSKSWFEKPENKNSIRQLKNNLYNYFRHVTNSPADKRLWTTYESSKNNLTGKGYGSSFLPCNARASNAYDDKTTLAFCINRYINPVIMQFLRDNNISIDQDEYALVQMLQWIWRSGIRAENPQHINIYIPSARMRSLLYEWLGYTDGEIRQLENSAEI